MAYVKYVHAPHQRMDKDSILHLKLVHVGLMKSLPKNDAHTSNLRFDGLKLSGDLNT